MQATFRRFALNTVLALSASLAVCATASAHYITTKISVDNGFSAYIADSDTTAGTRFSVGTDWGTVTSNYAALNGANQYYLHIAAYDVGGVAGLLGSFSLAGSGYHFADNSTTLLTGSSLLTANAIGFNGVYSATTSYGVNGVSPWGTLTGISSSAQWVWSGNNDANDVSYFSAVIFKDGFVPAATNVPEPGSLGLLGLGLLALTSVAAKSRKTR